MPDDDNPIDEELKKWKKETIKRVHGVEFAYKKKSEKQKKEDGFLNEAEKIRNAFVESGQIWRAMEKYLFYFLGFS